MAIEQLEERLFGFGHLKAQFLEGFLVVDEAVNDRGHGQAEGGLAVIGLPGALGDGGEMLHARQVVEAARWPRV